ncbi:MAG: phenylalanine--tRNA ligase subunit beta [Nocardioidaceae bacterium]
MRVPLSWLRDYVDLPDDLPAAAVADRLTALGLKLESLESPGSDVAGPLVVGRVLSLESEKHKNGKTVRWCRVDVGPEHDDEDGGRGIVCGADNFAVGDLVVVSLPGALLPGGFEISARKTYGHVSDGMICSTRELGTGEEHGGILVLGADEAQPGDDAVELLRLRDDVIEFEINPDRAYALSLRGVARDTAIGLGLPWRDPARIDVPAPNDTGYPVHVAAPDAAPVFAALTVTGLDPAAPTPRWMAHRIHLAGMRSISLAVDVTNYVMLELGQPIHGYDRRKLKGPIVVRRAESGEKVTTLDGVVRPLSESDLLITDDSGPIGLAGVMGGEHTELDEDSTDIVIEAANFDAPTVARTARTQKLPSEASRRFERGVDPAICLQAARRVADLLVEHGGGQIDPGVTLVGRPPAPAPITIAPDLPARISGITIDTPTAVGALEGVGCTVHSGGAALAVTPPSWRPDLTDPYDLVEEVARIVGYDKVPSVLPVAPAGRGLTTAQRLRRRTGQALAGAGFVEVKTYPFIGEEDLDRLGLGGDDVLRRTVRLENPLSEESPGLATTLLPGVLKAAERNVGRGRPDLGLFEIAHVYFPSDTGAGAPIPGVEERPSDTELAALDAALPAQPRFLAIVMSGDREPSGWWGSGRPVSWADPIEAVREVARVLGATVDVVATTRAPWHPGRCAQILLDGAEVGHAGELHPKVCDAYGVPPRTAAAEVDLDALIGAAPGVVAAVAFSTFPVAKEDVALVVGAEVPSATVAEALARGGGPLVESVRLFDVYTGGQIPAGRKSLAFALRLRAPDRTLTEDDAAQVRASAVAAAAETTGAVQRT